MKNALGVVQVLPVFLVALIDLHNAGQLLNGLLIPESSDLLLRAVSLEVVPATLPAAAFGAFALPFSRPLTLALVELRAAFAVLLVALVVLHEALVLLILPLTLAAAVVALAFALALVRAVPREVSW